jgi:hypothetical protein
VHSRRQGKHVCYECAPGRVRADRGPDGLAITVTHASGVVVPVSPNSMERVATGEEVCASINGHN